MKLYFLRHAHAEDPKGIADQERKLTPAGIKAAGAVARLLASLQVSPTHIYSSPRIRAVQTADIVASALGMTTEVQEALNFSFNSAAAAALIKKLTDEDAVMFVGHEPSMSVTIGEITGGRVEMKKAGLARVDILNRSPLRGQLVWLLAPKLVSAVEDL